ncbi:MFS transporter [Solicola sp. PLA-1-18]|uniref:MFS transporter n=1 Tax=Solicola sp. PLA-1-18 TaxID=3380532 RepID=UPI003B805D40
MSSAADEPLTPGSPELRRLNGAMLAAGLAGFGMLYATQPLMPQIADEFGVSAAASSLTVSAATGALAVCVLPMTLFAEAVGRVRVMRWGLVAAVVLLLLSAAAPSLAVLVGLRALLGVAVAAVVAVAMGHVGAVVDRRAVGATMGLYVAGNTLGGVGGRVVTAVAGDLAGWRVADATLAAFVAVAVAAFWWLLPAPRVVRGEVGARPSSASILLPHLRNAALLRLLVVPFALMGAFVAVYNYLSFRLVAPPFSLPVAVVGAVFLAYLSGTATSVLAGRLAARSDRRRSLVGWILVMGAGVAMTVPDQIVVVVAGLVVLTGGFFGAHAVASGWVPAIARRSDADVATAPASGLYLLAYYAGSSTFGALVGVAWARDGWDGTVLAVGVLVAVGLVAALSVRDTRSRA